MDNWSFFSTRIRIHHISLQYIVIQKHEKIYIRKQKNRVNNSCLFHHFCFILDFLVELTNDYEASYVMAGAVCLAGGVMIAISAVLNHYLKKRNCDNTPVLPPGDGESNHLTRTEARRKHLEAISLQSLGR